MARRRGGADEGVVEALRGVTIFSDLNQRQLSAVATAMKEVRQPEGTVLAREGDSGAGFFLIIDGTAEVRLREQPHQQLGPGDHFGEVALLDGGPRTASVVATSAVRMLGLTAWAFKAILQEHPSIAIRLLEVLAGHIRRASGQAGDA